MRTVGNQHNPRSSAFSSGILPSSNSYAPSPSLETQLRQQLSISRVKVPWSHPPSPCREHLSSAGPAQPPRATKAHVQESAHRKGNFTSTISTAENITVIWMKHRTKCSTGAGCSCCVVPNLTNQVFPPENFCHEEYNKWDSAPSTENRVPLISAVPGFCSSCFAGNRQIFLLAVR